MNNQKCALAALSLACAQPAVADAPAVAAKGPVPIDKVSSWITDDDYPRLAIQQNRQGNSQYRLVIDRTGNVQDCMITVSSGSADLDARTCSLLELRARFQPATNSAGEPTVGSYRSAVRWHLPDVFIPNSVYSVDSYIVEIDGSLSHCQIEQAAEGQQGIPRPVDCSHFGALRLGYRDSQNHPVRKQIVTRTTTTVSDIAPDGSAVSKK